MPVVRVPVMTCLQSRSNHLFVLFMFTVSRFDRDEPVPRASVSVPAPEPSTSAVVTAPSLQLPSILPPQVAEQIRSAQQRAALQNQAPATWAIGARCQAVFSGDGEWYNASVSGVTASDNFLITFAEYGNQEEVHRSNVRPRPDGSEVYRGVSAPKRKAVNNAPAQLEEMPKVTTNNLVTPRHDAYGAYICRHGFAD